MSIIDSYTEIQAASFQLEIPDVTIGHFTSISGLTMEVDVVEHKVTAQEKGQPFVKKMPGNAKYGELTLKRGLTPDLALFDWMNMVLQGKIAQARKPSASIFALDPEFAIIGEWTMLYVWPSKLTVSDLTAENDDIVTEELTIVFEHLTRKK